MDPADDSSAVGVCRGDECSSPWVGSLKGSPGAGIPTYNLHTTSISTVYQSDGEDISRWPSEDLHGGVGGGSGPAASPVGDASGATELLAASGVESSADIDSCLKRVDYGLKANELLNRAFQEFCTIGFEYADRLQALADGMGIAFEGDSSCAGAAIGSLRSYILKSVAAQRDFLEAVSHECPIVDQCSGRYAELKGGVEHTKAHYAASEAHRVALAASVEDLYLQSKSAFAMCSEAFHEPPSVKTRLHGALIPVFLSFISKSRELDELPHERRRSGFEAETAGHKEAVRALDQERLLSLRDSLSKFTIYETARVRNLQYDLCAVVDELNAFDPDADWQAFDSGGHRELTSSTEDPSLSTAPPYASYLKTAIPEVFRNYAISRLTLSAPKERVLRRIENCLSRFLDAVWNDSPSSVDMGEFVGEMQSSLVRQVFCGLLTTYSLRSNQLPSMASMKLLVRMVVALLSFSQRQGDAWSGYSILKLSDFIHVLDEGAAGQVCERCSLRPLIYGHQYWSRISFWEECLLIAVAQDIKVLFEESQGSPTLRPVTEELLHFLNWMTGFGIAPAEASSLVGRVCGRLGLPSEYAQALLSCGAA